MEKETVTKKKSKLGLFTIGLLIVLLLAGGGGAFLYITYNSVSFINEAAASGTDKTVFSVNVWVPEKDNAVIDAKNVSSETGYRGTDMKNVLSKGVFKVYIHNHSTGNIISTNEFKYTEAESGFRHQLILTKSKCIKSCSWHWKPAFDLKQHCRFVYANKSCPQ